MVIQVNQLSKTYQVVEKETGLKGSIKSFFKPITKTLKAVTDVSFSVDKGEMVGFIGPNGAGKSTVIKMMTGILYPTDGDIRILDRQPWKERRKLSYDIGTVFGQKSQLWFHLPPNDTFELLATIYDMDKNTFTLQRDMVIELFELQHFLKTPVRKLSLGQRMKCEIAAALIHNPKLIFLDEPTIGLDVVSKQQIRNALKKVNIESKTTIFITSHDSGDIESLCERVIVLDHGKIIFDDKLNVLKNKYMSERVLKIQFQEEITNCFIPNGIHYKVLDPFSVEISIDTNKVVVADVIQKFLEQNNVVDIVINELPMDELIRTIFKQMNHQRKLVSQ
ncbi:ABC transporter ATP-binding protein [Paenibacillus sp. T2-29]|uniref:ABC transporter ATP-binding protein n=1 Tax=Paenibacillus TaxID=44249 RepID=UPI0039BCE8B4